MQISSPVKDWFVGWYVGDGGSILVIQETLMEKDAPGQPQRCAMAFRSGPAGIRGLNVRQENTSNKMILYPLYIGIHVLFSAQPLQTE